MGWLPNEPSGGVRKHFRYLLYRYRWGQVAREWGKIAAKRVDSAPEWNAWARNADLILRGSTVIPQLHIPSIVDWIKPRHSIVSLLRSIVIFFIQPYSVVSESYGCTIQGELRELVPD